MPPFTPKQVVLLWHKAFLWIPQYWKYAGRQYPIIARLTNICSKYLKIESNSVCYKKTYTAFNILIHKKINQEV